MSEAEYRALVSETKGLSKALNKQMNLDNQLGTANKPPKLLSLEDYPMWKDRFYNYILGLDASLWIAIEDGYEVPNDEHSVPVLTIGKLTAAQRVLFEREKKMLNQIYQGLGNDIQHQLKQFKTAKSLWLAMKERFMGNSEMFVGKQSLLKKEFEIFYSYKGEGLNDVITRYCHLLSEMDEYKLGTMEKDKVLKLADGLPEAWDGFVLILKQRGTFGDYTVTDLIGKLQAHELTIRQKQKMHSQTNSLVQDPHLYMGGGDSFGEQTIENS